MSDDDLAALRRWHDAANAGDVEGAVRECAGDVSVRGPRGTGQGHQLVRDWLTRSGIRLEPLEDLGDLQDTAERDGRYVVRERAQWTTAVSEPVETHCVFVVYDALVRSIARYDDPAQVPPA